jgi:hypothetical protein
MRENHPRQIGMKKMNDTSNKETALWGGLVKWEYLVDRKNRRAISYLDMITRLKINRGRDQEFVEQSFGPGAGFEAEGNETWVMLALNCRVSHEITMEI